MISTELFNYSQIVRPLLAAMLVLMLLIGWGLAARRAQRLSTVLAVLAGIAALALTAWPDPRAGTGGVTCTVQFSVPFVYLDSLANVALFVPVTYAAVLACRRPVVVALAASATSAAIEITQAFLPSLGRVCDTDDWFMNTLGAVVGVSLAAATLWLAGRRGGSSPR